MSETYSKPCQTSKMMKNIKKLGIIKTAYSGIFRDPLRHSTIFGHIMKNVKADSHIIETY